MGDSASESQRFAAVSYLERSDGRLLCVWNQRYEGWSLPGGMVEDGETPEAALARELREETALELSKHELIFEGEHGLKVAEGRSRGRASVVRIYRVEVNGTPRAVEKGCPIAWLSREEFLAWSTFARFYERVFAVVEPRMTGQKTDARALSYDEMVLACRNVGVKAEKEEKKMIAGPEDEKKARAILKDIRFASEGDRVATETVLAVHIARLRDTEERYRRAVGVASDVTKAAHEGAAVLDEYMRWKGGM